MIRCRKDQTGDKFVDKMLEKFIALYRIRKNLLDNELDRWKNLLKEKRE